uniref:Transposase n=1 Tax=Thermosporothrix sp. COM3 TaxID=2490863 RepID=A0A455SI36_9CHLR|nr:transposase [Thermosporothrix sp. COM3]
MPVRTYTYRLYPTKHQAEKLTWTLDLLRELYNAAVQERRDCYRYTGKGTSYTQQAAQLSDIKELRPEYQKIHSQVLQDTLRRVEKAFQAFFRRVKNGETPGYPRFQGKNRFDSFTYPQSGFSLTHDNRLCLSKIGSIKVKLHRPLLGKVKTCTIKREGEHWYVCLACEAPTMPRTPYTDGEVGVDLGVSKLATLSTGDVIEHPRFYRRAQKKLAKAQAALARKQRGSQRRKKAVKRVARLHRKVRHQRTDYLHKWSRWLVNTYQTIVFEELAPATLSKRPKVKQDAETGQYLPNGASAKAGLNKSILDAGWRQFVTFCQYKAEEAGTVHIVMVDPKYTSQICSRCGTVKKKELSERWHTCECGCSLDRDHNAALNILRLGRSLQANA